MSNVWSGARELAAALIGGDEYLDASRNRSGAAERARREHATLVAPG